MSREFSGGRWCYCSLFHCREKAKSGPCPWPALPAAFRDIDGTALTLDNTDSEPLRFFCTRKMRYYSGAKRIGSSDIKPGSRVTVESKNGAGRGVVGYQRQGGATEGALK